MRRLDDCRACPALHALDALGPLTGWTCRPQSGLGTPCRKGRLRTPLELAPCTGIVTCFTVRESRSRAAADTNSPARSCGHQSFGLHHEQGHGASSRVGD